MQIPYLCPYCQQHSVLNAQNFHFWGDTLKGVENADGINTFDGRLIICANKQCRRISLELLAGTFSTHLAEHQFTVTDPSRRWKLLPDSRARPYPDFVPQAIREDYREACLIVDLSPKASATLTRRALQGLIRDFWQVSTPRGRLHDEINAIKDRVEPSLWEAINAVRDVGNIGAHMEADISHIVAVDPGEAEALIQLLELLIEETYINRARREQKVRAVKDVAAQKSAQKKAGPPPARSDAPAQ